MTHHSDKVIFASYVHDGKTYMIRESDTPGMVTIARDDDRGRTLFYVPQGLLDAYGLLDAIGSENIDSDNYVADEDLPDEPAAEIPCPICKAPIGKDCRPGCTHTGE